MTDRADLTATDISILRELDAGTLEWGAAVSACWPALVRAGYVEPNFGGITDDGRAALLREAAKALGGTTHE